MGLAALVASVTMLTLFAAAGQGASAESGPQVVLISSTGVTLTGLPRTIVRTVNPLTGQSRLQAGLAKFSGDELWLSSDGRVAAWQPSSAFVGQGFVLHLVARPSLKPEQSVTSPADEIYFGVTWSRGDGTIAAILSNATTGVRDVVVIDSETGDQHDLGPADEVSLAPDGTWVLVRRFVKGRGEGLWRIDLKTGTARLLLPNCNEPAVSSTGDEIAYTNAEGAITVRRAGGGTPDVVMPAMNGYATTDLAWSPNGKNLAFVEVTVTPHVDESHAYVIGVDGKGLREIGTAVNYTSVLWST